MQKIICITLVFFLNVSVAFSKYEKIGSCQSFMKDGKFDVVQLRNEELFKKSNNFASNILEKIFTGVRNGVEPCFKTGVALLDSEEIQFAHTRGWLTGPFADLLQKNPSLFKKYSAKYPMSIRSMVHVFSIDWDDLEEFRKSEILRDIKIRKEYIKKYLGHEFETNLNYIEVMDSLNKMSLKNLEVVKKDGSRIVYTSTYPYLNSNIKYKLSHLIDSDKKTAWCVDYNDVSENKGNYSRPLIKAKFYNYKGGIKCRGENNNKFKCYVKGVKFSISSGYQKNATVFNNNVRLKSIDVHVEPVNGSPYTPEKTEKINIHFNDKQTTKKHYFLLDKYLESYSPLYIKVYADSVFKGKKYNDLCISNMEFNLIK